MHRFILGIFFFFFSYGSEVIFIIWEQKHYSVKFWQKIIFLPGRLSREISEVASCLQPILSPICPSLEDTIPTADFKDWEEHFCTGTPELRDGRNKVPRKGMNWRKSRTDNLTVDGKTKKMESKTKISKNGKVCSPQQS